MSPNAAKVSQGGQYKFIKDTFQLVMTISISDIPVLLLMAPLLWVVIFWFTIPLGISVAGTGDRCLCVSCHFI
jgi:hypothetical protein